MTVSEGQPTLSVDPEASLRAELLSTIAGAQFDIDNAIAELARSGADASALVNQRQSLQQLQKQVGSASFATLAGLRAEIAGAVATTQTLTEQGRANATTAGQAAAEALATASANSRAQVTSIMRDMHRFDPYLHFASAEDEAAYRKREAERLAYIDAQHAKGTAEGNLNAAGATVAQLADAETHGAGNSPEFKQRKRELVESTIALRNQMHANGQSTEEFDQRLEADLRRIAQAKGHFDHAAPRTANAQVSNPNNASESVVRPSSVSNEITANPNSPAPISESEELSDVMAALRSAGVQPTPPSATASTARCVPASQRAGVECAVRS
jgi:hypothetical protein